MLKDFQEFIKGYIYQCLKITSLYITVFTISFGGFVDFVSEKINSDSLE